MDGALDDDFVAKLTAMQFFVIGNAQTMDRLLRRSAAKSFEIPFLWTESRS